MMNLNNKNILITGASRGIGFGVVEKLLKEHNCNIATVSRKIDSLDELFSNARKGDRKFKAYSCDVTEKQSVAETYKNITSDFGEIDIAILNAGVGYLVTPETFNSEFAEKTFAVNFLGVIYFIEQLLPSMIERKSGIIAGVSSLADARGFSGSGFYCASKAALSTYLEGLRIELFSYGIKVITIKPGFVKTDMTDQNNFDMPFLMDIHKSADYIINGIKKEKREIAYPFATAFGSKLIRKLPDTFYEFLAKRFKLG
ncbi:MAG: short-chain dehydrogenase [Melioribacteraceae bacterium]|nr:MAG: short-chain dehydrogenase [Melioribacteraceae bacterium]